ncbi:hypothetical protein Val02_41160 [Virgisporangium aliadipatigenens]|uniref:Laminin G domain-containing protein n=1 Tax=Virgisporangium aliadipatigenens TaxID=741659 RepID=A0A8J4DQN6_9ACTN|nr:LamG-like jellyroll fold domain-containing protein [Virgisporangium aliadipatigenens]GIJ47230.1 hypothetical protein Val02_41160 [Virgisporangium aliadipatigenens]
MRFDFDRVIESNGALRLEAVPESGAALESHVAAGGRLRSESHGSGRAVRFPAVCPTYGDPGCPRAILEADAGAAVSPGDGDFRYGASVLVRPDETTEGANVLQKGYSVGHSQFKLQIDGKAGRPSCVLVGTDSSEIHVVTAPTTVANGQWHAIDCVRSGMDLSVSVDGVIVGQRNVPGELSIVNSDPIRIGGKGTAPNNDQFHGAIDDAYVAIGP